MKKPLFLTLAFSMQAFCLFAQFAAAHHISPTLYRPQTIASADLDGDGEMDVITGAENALAWFRNEDGMGGFSDPIIIPTDSKDILHVHAVDQDGDGDQDLLFVSGNTFKIAWLENLDGAGNFSPEKAIANIASTFSYAYSADLDGDGDQDLICTAGGSILWFKHLDGMGNFGPQTLISSTTNPAKWVFAEDLDGDGDKDLVCGRSANSTGGVGLFKNLDGQGTFGSEIHINNTVGANAIVPADVDGDGNTDIVAVGNYGLFWHKNTNGSGNFGPMQLIQSLSGNPKALSAADFDGDGDIDLVTASESGTAIIWFKNLDGQSFTAYSTGFLQTLSTVVSSDLNGNGYPDLLSINGLYNHLVWFDNLNGAFGDPIYLYKEGAFSESAFPSDLDGDGDQDIVATYAYYFEGEIFWYENENAAFEIAQPIFQTLGHPENSSAADIDGDGDQDILVFQNTSKDSIKWLENLGGSGNFAAPEAMIPTESPGEILPGDLDSDNVPDLVILSKNGIFWVREEAGSFAIQAYFQTLPTDKSSGAFITDFDGDGDNDVLTAYTPTGQNAKISWFENLDGQGNFGSEVILATAPNNAGSWAVLAADFDGDGDKDIAYGLFSGIFWQENIDNAGNFGPAQYIATGSYGYHLASFDFDLDGDQDLVSAHALLLGVKIYENLDGAGSFHPGVKIFNDDSNTLSPADLDGDGDIDLLISSDYLIWLENLATSLPRIEGLVFWDQNENGVQDGPEEVGLNDQKLQLTPPDMTTFSLNGGYSFNSLFGYYDVTCIPSPLWALTTDATQDANLQTPLVSLPPFGLKALAPVHTGEADISSGLVRCNRGAPFWISCHNQGNTFLHGTLTLTIDPLTTVLNSIPAPDLIDGNTLTWNLASLPPTYTEQIRLILMMPSEDYAGETLAFQAVMDILDSGGNPAVTDTYTYSPQLRCAVDPNDKLVEPNIPEEENYTLFGDTLRYTVRFQNTGNDTAFTVRIVDQLSPDLDPASFRLIASSHPCSASLDAHGKLVFLFENILLPDSTTNEPESHGFVKFGILPHAGLPENTVISNDANIFFDANAPILTNAVTNILVSAYPLELAIQSPLCHDSYDGFIQASALAPEPVTYQWNNGQNGSTIEGLTGGEYTLEVYNAEGQLVGDTVITLTAPAPIGLSVSSTPEIALSQNGTATVVATGGTPPYTYNWGTQPVQANPTVTGLSAGIYWVTVTDANGCQQTSSAEVEQVVSVSEAQGKSVFLIHPNPAPGVATVRIEAGFAAIWEIKVHDAQGRLLSVSSLPGSASAPATFDLEPLSSGVYEVSLWREGVLAGREKLVVQ
ncbi:MAG: FG-GAP-like repeat-containing protein [Saprospiraceae bacterium]